MKRTIFIFLLQVLAGTALVASNSRGLAQEAGVDHDRARAAVQSGEIMPLHEILAKVSEKQEGRVLEVRLNDLEEGLHGWVYDIRLFTPEDEVLFLRVDAGTATILLIERGGAGDQP